MINGTWRYLHRTILAPTTYQTRKYNHTFRISARPSITRSSQIIFNISRLKTSRESQKQRCPTTFHLPFDLCPCTAPSQAFSVCKNSTVMSEKFNIRSLFVFPVAYFNQLRKHKIPVARNLKTKSTKLEQKIQKKTVSFKNSFSFRVSGFCTKGFSGCTNAENGV